MPRFHALAIFATVSLFIAGCGPEVELDPADRATIETGVYGILTNGCDTAGCQSSASSDRVVYAVPQGAMPGAEPFASEPSDDAGFYQIALEPGTYALSFDAAVAETEVTITERSRCDWASGPGGGNWSCQDE